MTWKTVDEMTVEEARSEMYHLESYFEECEEFGQGISSKESVRHRLCKQKVGLFDMLGIETDDIAQFMRDGHRLMAPVGCDCYDCDPEAYSKALSGKKEA
jgi:hypothetical protein